MADLQFEPQPDGTVLISAVVGEKRFGASYPIVTGRDVARVNGWCYDECAPGLQEACDLQAAQDQAQRKAVAVKTVQAMIRRTEGN